jgi:hypothetical protein
MLPELIIRQWLGESSIRERVQEIGSEEIIAIQKMGSNLKRDTYPTVNRY